MPGRTIIEFFAIAALAAACDVFIPDVGHLGEPCAGSYITGECYGDLVCINGTCSNRAGVGEACDLNEEENEYGDFEIHPEEDCMDGLWCLGEECIEAGGEDQPCRIDEWAWIMCDSDHDYEIPPCDDGLACIITTEEDGWSITGHSCRRLDDVAGSGQACLCSYASFDDEDAVCWSVCEDSYYYDEGICADGLYCNNYTGLCQ